MFHERVNVDAHFGSIARPSIWFQLCLPWSRYGVIGLSLVTAVTMQFAPSWWDADSSVFGPLDDVGLLFRIAQQYIQFIRLVRCSVVLNKYSLSLPSFYLFAVAIDRKWKMKWKHNSFRFSQLSLCDGGVNSCWFQYVQYLACIIIDIRANNAMLFPSFESRGHWINSIHLWWFGVCSSTRVSHTTGDMSRPLNVSFDYISSVGIYILNVEVVQCHVVLTCRCWV